MAVSQALSVTQVSQSVKSNYSTVRILWTSTQSGNSYNGYTRTANYYVSVNGGAETTYTVSYTLPKGSTKTILDINITVPHNADGTGSVKVRTRMDTGISAGVVEKSQSLTLTTIPRASKMSVPNGTLDVAQNISVTRQSTNFKHTITCKCGLVSETICENSSETSISWTPGLHLAYQASQRNSVSVSFTITTYSGNTEIGTTNASATYEIPDSLVPVLLPSTTDSKGHKEKYGNFVQNQSKLAVDIDAYSSYGAWITSYKTTFEGKTYTSENVETPVISKAGDLPLVITVTDSRGRSTKVNNTVKVLEWYAPKIKALKAYRSNQDGSSNPYGAYLSVKFSDDFAPVGNKNKAGRYVEYKKSTEPETQYKSYFVTGAAVDNYSLTDFVYTFPADTASSYDIQLRLYDDFEQNGVTKYTSGASVKKVFSLLKKGGEIVGFALNKLAEIEGVFDIGWQTRFSGGILHPVLPTNSDLNMCLTPQTYMLLSSNTYTNAPENGVGMFLEIVGIKDTSLIQKCSVFDKSGHREYERIYYTTNGWEDWKCVRGDFVVEQGEKDGWTYRKWNSGAAECFKMLTVNMTISNKWGNLYLSSSGVARQNYPFGFVSKPVENVTVQGNAPVWLCTASSGNGVNGAYASAMYHLCSPGEYTSSIECYLSYSINGKWK